MLLVEDGSSFDAADAFSDGTTLLWSTFVVRDVQPLSKKMPRFVVQPFLRGPRSQLEQGESDAIDASCPGSVASQRILSGFQGLQ